jgi:hypothetical protein
MRYEKLNERFDRICTVLLIKERSRSDYILDRKVDIPLPWADMEASRGS